MSGRILFLLTGILFLSIITNGQKMLTSTSLGSYENFREKLNMNVFMHYPSFWNMEIEGYTNDMEEYGEEAGIVVSSDNYKLFRESLVEAKKIFEKWAKKEIANNSSGVKTEFYISSPHIGGYYVYNKNYYYTDTLKLKYHGLTFQDAEWGHTLPWFIIRSGEFILSKSKNRKCSGFMFIFASPDEIGDFIDMFSEEAIESHKKSLRKKSLR